MQHANIKSKRNLATIRSKLSYQSNQAWSQKLCTMSYNDVPVNANFY